MKLDKKELVFLKRNEKIIVDLLERRIDDLKEQILDCPEDKRENLINFIKEYKLGLSIVRDVNNDKKSEDWTGI